MHRAMLLYSQATFLAVLGILSGAYSKLVSKNTSVNAKLRAGNKQHLSLHTSVTARRIGDLRPAPPSWLCCRQSIHMLVQLSNPVTFKRELGSSQLMKCSHDCEHVQQEIHEVKMEGSLIQCAHEACCAAVAAEEDKNAALRQL